MDGYSRIKLRYSITIEVSDESVAKSLAEFIKKAIISGVDLMGDGALGKVAFTWSLPAVINRMIGVDRDSVVDMEEREDEVLLYTRLGSVIRTLVRLNRINEYSYSVEVQVIEATQPVVAVEET